MTALPPRPPGDPTSIRSAARKLRDTADALRAEAGRPGTHWDSMNLRMGAIGNQVRTSITASRERVDRATALIESTAAALEKAATQVESALANWRRACAAARDAQ